MKHRKNKSVSFRLVDAYERELLAWAESNERGDYSKYIKRLISRDMEGRGYVKPDPMNRVPTIIDVGNANEDFSSFI